MHAQVRPGCGFICNWATDSFSTWRYCLSVLILTSAINNIVLWGDIEHLKMVWHMFSSKVVLWIYCKFATHAFQLLFIVHATCVCHNMGSISTDRGCAHGVCEFTRPSHKLPYYLDQYSVLVTVWCPKKMSPKGEASDRLYKHLNWITTTHKNKPGLRSRWK